MAGRGITVNRRHGKPIEVTPEVLPPESEGRSGDRPRPEESRGPSRMNLALIGLLLDMLDFLTRGTLGIRFGLPLGFIAAFVLLTLAGVPLRRRVLYSAAAGVYCLIPGTERFPLGTVFGVLLRLR